MTMLRGSNNEESAPGSESLTASFNEHNERMRTFRRSHTRVATVNTDSRRTEVTTPPVIVTEGGLLEMAKRPLVLAVDDEEPILKLLRVNLTAEGYDVITASDGIVALKLFKENIPDLLLLDIMMPDLDGMQILNRIRRTSNIPIIMITAKCEVTTLRDSLALGADDYVCKPFSIMELTARIRAKVRLAERRNEAVEIVAAHAAL